MPGRTTRASRAIFTNRVAVAGENLKKIRGQATQPLKIQPGDRGLRSLSPELKAKPAGDLHHPRRIGNARDLAEVRRVGDADIGAGESHPVEDVQRVRLKRHLPVLVNRKFTLEADALVGVART